MLLREPAYCNSKIRSARYLHPRLPACCPQPCSRFSVFPEPRAEGAQDQAIGSHWQGRATSGLRFFCRALIFSLCQSLILCSQKLSPAHDALHSAVCGYSARERLLKDCPRKRIHEPALGLCTEPLSRIMKCLSLHCAVVSCLVFPPWSLSLGAS